MLFSERDMHEVPRRRFITGLFLGTAYSTIVGKSWSSLYAATLAPASHGPGFQIKVSDYPALLEEIGSVRLGVNQVGIGDNAFPEGRYYPIIINRDFNGFYVLDSICKHAGCVVNTFDVGEFVMRCPCHGSLYDIRGDVVEGPANEAMTPMDFTYDEATDILHITVPDLQFNVKAFLPPSAPGARLQLEFLAHGGVTYEVRFREKLTDPWQPIFFSLTPNGPANQNLLIGNGDPNTLYVDRTTPTGFYAVSMVLSEV
jgi:Rieske Fe-S protein